MTHAESSGKTSSQCGALPPLGAAQGLACRPRLRTRVQGSPVDPDAEVCLHVLRLVQSVVLEPEVFSKSASELRSSLPLQRILAMSKSRNPRLQSVAHELLEDLRALERDA